MHIVAVLALHGVMPFEMAIPHRIFGSAFDHEGNALYDVRLCSLDGEPVMTNADFAITVGHDASVLAEADTVIIPPAGTVVPDPGPPDVPVGLDDALDTMRPDARLVSLCGAAFLLAALGKLEGRPATTHWILTTQFRTSFPSVGLDPDILFVDDGDVLTAAGSAAAIDLCLHLVRRDHGSEVANRVARYCVVPPYREGGQRQFVESPVPDRPDTSTERSRRWALEHLAERISVGDMARYNHMSLRTFSRRFQEEVGISPGRWLTHRRIDHARTLLETTELTVDHIATAVGFGTGTALRQHFAASVGVSPTAYRRTFNRAVPAGR
jgi:transcriptional regulator GlxA family with amidase domain